MDDIDRTGRHAAAVLSSVVERRIDADAALRRLLEGEQGGAAVVIADARSTHRRRARVVVACAVAAVALIVGGVVLARGHGPSRLVPTDETTVTEPAIVSTRVAETVASAASTTLPAAPGSDAQAAIVTVDTSTPVVDGETIYSSGLANTHEWYSAVTPSGRVFIGPSDGTSARISEVVDGQLVDTGITSGGSLRSGLDERLYSIDWMTTGGIAVWAQGADGAWSVVDSGSDIGDCGLTVQPGEVRCGQAVIPVVPPADAPTLEWSGMELSATKGDDVSRWAISLESTEASTGDCTDDQCQVAWRVGGDVAWTPILEQTSRPSAQLVSMLHPDAPPTTGWLNCGAGCRVIGVHDEFLYTVGFAPDAAGDPSINIRRFDAALLAAPVDHDTTVDAMAGWPTAPDDHPTLDDVPMLFPANPPPNTEMPRRTEYADDPALPRYKQIWFSATTQAVLWVETGGNQMGAPEPSEPTDLAPWNVAAFANMAPGYEELSLIDPSGSSVIWSHGLDRDQVIAIARSMQLRPLGTPGWNLQYLPDGLTPAYEGWSLGAATRTVRWSGTDAPDAELEITHGVPGLFLTPWVEGTTIAFVDVNGTAGVLYQLDDGRTAVVWSPAPDVAVMFAIRDPSAAVVTGIARSIHQVDQATWKGSSTDVSATTDGCNSMFC